ncbi:MAG: hypothetical protein LUG16_05720 [Candidatus Gastranaerophilales bacterium]|nr:hypothetical protein [Candidatus Gastranaerophilales bacterium]
MKVSPISFGANTANLAKQSANSEYIPTTVRHNALSDMEFNIIADTIRCQNLKNQMSIRLHNLKRSLNNCMAQNLYNNHTI